MRLCACSKTGESRYFTRLVLSFIKSSSFVVAMQLAYCLFYNDINNVVFFFFLIQNRLVEDEERRWTDENIDNVALKHFPNIDREKALNRPILYSNWLSKVGLKDYEPETTCYI